MAGGDPIVPEWSGKIVGDDGHDRIAACLALDFQNAPGWCKQALSQIDNVISGREKGWDIAMNAYMLKVRADESEILPVYEETGEPGVIVKTADLRGALMAWSERIAQSRD